ncbi:MAG: ATP-binding protein [Clostridia bacterium]|nr:ATP-binding protein [Clostridia bacterium]
MPNNPYVLTFGKEPVEMIPRLSQSKDLIESFMEEKPSQQICLITGVRGSGKTVFMSTISREIASDNHWIVVELNPERDLLISLAAKLNSMNYLANIFKTAKINLSFLGIGLEVSGSAPLTDIESALIQMLEAIQKHNKKVLITIDEVSNTSNMRIFASTFQILLRKNLPVFLLMTGLYENIHSLQNEKSMTFLYRAPKITLEPLNIGTMTENYQQVLKYDYEKALKYAKLTKGYSFAFQVLGYFSWKYKDDEKRIYIEFKQYLEEYVYEKIWAELSAIDRDVAYAIAESPDGSISDIRQHLNMDSNQFNPYRMRLIRKGIVNGQARGYLYFTLPCFAEFVKESHF